MMTWLLMWLNMSVATLNATLQLLVIYRFVKNHEVPDLLATGSQVDYPRKAM